MDKITITNLPSGKNEVRNFVKTSKELILSGEEDIKLYLVKLKMFEEAIKALREDAEIKAHGEAEIEKYGGTTEAYGATLSLRNSVKYDYSQDDEWALLQQSIDMIKDKQKERESFLKALKKPVADAETGEIIYPAIKASATSIIVALKK